MKNMKTLTILLTGFAIVGLSYSSQAQHHPSGDKVVQLHVNPRWKECSFQLDPSLTQKAWREFTREAGLVVYFSPLSDAKPMGAKNFEISLLQWKTKFDDTKEAWNNTFVHPDSVHWLKEGARLSIPGLMFRAGVTKKLDVSAYITKSPGANYGFWGAQAQYSLLNGTEKEWNAAARASVLAIYGPEDVSFAVYGVDLLASKEFGLNRKWASVAPYAGVSSYLTTSHEKSSVVDLQDEVVGGGRAMLGALFKLSIARVGVEYSIARLNTISLKVGVGF
jgi:hypothetical protein